MSTDSPKSGTIPSSNWLALQKRLGMKTTIQIHAPGSRPERKKSRSSTSSLPTITQTGPESGPSSFPRSYQNNHHTKNNSHVYFETTESKDGESISALRQMIFGKLEYTLNQQEPGKYLAIDCEMVGVGINGGEESSLARVSIVNFHGALQMDEFVRQRERVVDYRTQWSGIRPSDMIHAKPFAEVQKKVSELLNDRILVGHAVHNDLKALLLSHPSSHTRDTQQLAGIHKLLNTKRPALRKLVEQELGIAIQTGEHSSLIDARATMAVFRLHRKEWEKGINSARNGEGRSARSSKKRKQGSLSISEDTTAVDNPPVKKAKKGISSGLSTIVTRVVNKRVSAAEKMEVGWWETVDGSS